MCEVNKTVGSSGKIMRMTASLSSKTGAAQILGDGRCGFHSTQSSPETGE